MEDLPNQEPTVKEMVEETRTRALLDRFWRNFHDGRLEEAHMNLLDLWLKCNSALSDKIDATGKKN
jgi:hypothetical protein